MMAPVPVLVLVLMLVCLASTGHSSTSMSEEEQQQRPHLRSSSSLRASPQSLYDTVPYLRTLHQHFTRLLAGSNCVQIERGTVSVYYLCEGCLVAEAIGCVDDMRKNKSGNVFPGCDMNKIFESNGGFPDHKSLNAPNGPFSGANVHDTTNPFNYTDIFYSEAQACCPQKNVDGPSVQINGASILVASAAYIDALDCINRAGCTGGQIYNQLLEECYGLCNPPDDDATHYAPFNMGNSICQPPPITESTKSAAFAFCFADSETVQLDDGRVKALKDVVVGDKVAVATMNGKSGGFSEVIFLPHASSASNNNRESSSSSSSNSSTIEFVRLVLSSGKGIKLTPEHLLLVASYNTDASSPLLVSAKSVSVGQLVHTQDGLERVVASLRERGHGVSTIITMRRGELLVVNGIVASPFAVNHFFVDAFYSLHRFMHASSFFATLIRQRSWLHRATQMVGDVAAYFALSLSASA